MEEQEQDQYEDGFVFEYDAPEEEEVQKYKFRIMDEKFEADPMPAWVYFRYISAMGSMVKGSKANASERSQTIAATKLDDVFAVFEKVLDDDSYDRFEKIMSKRGAPGMNDLIDLIEALTEKTANRPTNGSTPSRSGPSRAKGSSTGSSSVKALARGAEVSGA